MMNQRIIGIDVARAIAVIGMIIVNFKIVLGTEGEGWLKSFSQMFDGKAAATFVVLAGVGIALMSNTALKAQNRPKLKAIKLRIVKRAIFFFIVGLSYIWIWPADILHFYGIYLLIALLFLQKTAVQISIAIVSFILAFPLANLFLDYEAGWDFNTLAYEDFWTPIGFIRNLLFNGFHPAIPWAAFVLFGLWFGRQDLRDIQFLKKSILISLGIFIITQIASYSLTQIFFEQEDLALLFGTDPMPPMPVYMVNGISIATSIISSSILIAQKNQSNKIIISLNQTGQLSLTFYVAHVVIGMGFLEGFGLTKLGEYSIEFSMSYALSFSLACILFASLWLKYFKMGPLEWLMRKLVN